MYGRTSPHAKFCDPKIKGSGSKKLAKVETSQKTDDRRQTTDREETKYRKTRKKHC